MADRPRFTREGSPPSGRRRRRAEILVRSFEPLEARSMLSAGLAGPNVSAPDPMELRAVVTAFLATLQQESAQSPTATAIPGTNAEVTSAVLGSAWDHALATLSAAHFPHSVAYATPGWPSSSTPGGANRPSEVASSSAAPGAGADPIVPTVSVSTNPEGPAPWSPPPQPRGSVLGFALKGLSDVLSAQAFSTISPPSGVGLPSPSGPLPGRGAGALATLLRSAANGAFATRPPGDLVPGGLSIAAGVAVPSGLLDSGINAYQNFATSGSPPTFAMPGNSQIGGPQGPIFGGLRIEPDHVWGTSGILTWLRDLAVPRQASGTLPDQMFSGHQAETPAGVFDRASLLSLLQTLAGETTESAAAGSPDSGGTRETSSSRDENLDIGLKVGRGASSLAAALGLAGEYDEQGLLLDIDLPGLTALALSILDGLLGKPVALSLPLRNDIEEVAELLPLGEGLTIALAATLSTVPGASSQPAMPIAGGSSTTPAPRASAPSWAGFVSGLDEAFERSREAARLRALATAPGSRQEDQSSPGGRPLERAPSLEDGVPPPNAEGSLAPATPEGEVAPDSAGRGAAVSACLTILPAWLGGRIRLPRLRSRGRRRSVAAVDPSHEDDSR